MIILDIIKEAYKIANNRDIEKKNTRNWFNVALAYNKIHTYSSHIHGKWMCPMCHTIHECDDYSAFTGLQYPKCCDYPAGHRLDSEYATDVNNIKPLKKPTERYKP